MVSTHVVGFPRIGKNREYKKALEAYWKKEITQAALIEVGHNIESQNWQDQKDSGADLISVGDFCWYDHILQWSLTLGVIPPRFEAFANSLESQHADNQLDLEFAIARGTVSSDKNIPASEMTKWFNTNYHYIVPELNKQQTFNLKPQRLLGSCQAAVDLKHQAKLTIPGPLSYLYLSKGEFNPGFDDEKLELLPALLDAYLEFLQAVDGLGITWIQIEEPILVVDLPDNWQRAFRGAYDKLNESELNCLLCTYFGELRENLELALSLPTAGLHLDAVSNLKALNSITLPKNKVISLGIIDGSNIWKNDLNHSLDLLKSFQQTHTNSLWLSSSCSLLHCPIDLNLEKNLDPEIRSWLAFGLQKLDELNTLKKGLNEQRGNTLVSSLNEKLNENLNCVNSRKHSARVNNQLVHQQISELKESDFHRSSPFNVRENLQQQAFNLPKFPTTTIGSFPQTQEIRKTRRLYKNGELSEEAYRLAMQKEIRLVIEEQEALELDMLVHGEAERNDMVEYFGALLEGFTFSDFGWVQSFGSRCVKPPIIYGDISRKKAMTVEWAKYAQSLSQKPVKGMLTGPVTILCWSFVRDDIALEQSCQQIALALREEVSDLEAAGINIIQIDEPALREGLPLRQSDWQHYLNWAVRCFRLSASVVKDSTQIHTHMCYAEFNDIIKEIAELDADVITIESSRSNMELLKAFSDFDYPNQIGPGVWDIHSPQVPNQAAMSKLMSKASEKLAPEKLWLNPDCGLKTRGWEECRLALQELVASAKEMRLRYE